MDNLILVDSDLLIDVSRQQESAIQRLEREEKASILGISVVTQMELMIGCRNKKDFRLLENFLNRFKIIHLNEKISDIAVELLRKYRLSHGLMVADSLIAATALNFGIPLLTKNQKDYRFIDNLEVLPYP